MEALNTIDLSDLILTIDQINLLFIAKRKCFFLKIQLPTFFTIPLSSGNDMYIPEILRFCQYFYPEIRDSYRDEYVLFSHALLASIRRGHLGIFQELMKNTGGTFQYDNALYNAIKLGRTFIAKILINFIYDLRKRRIGYRFPEHALKEAIVKKNIAIVREILDRRKLEGIVSTDEEIRFARSYPEFLKLIIDTRWEGYID